MNDQKPAQQAVIIYFTAQGEDAKAPIAALIDDLKNVMSASHAGTFDGHEVELLEADDVYIFLSGPDADLLYDAIKPILESNPIVCGGDVTLRYGGPNDDLAPVHHIPITLRRTPRAA